MRMKPIAVMCAAVLVIGILGCSSTPTPKGCIYTKVQGPFTVTANLNSPKVGRATASSVLGIVAWGDSSIKKACESAGITKIHHVDYEDFNILLVYMTYTTVVYGE
ncbi:MAG TPA: TRL-like family protein [Spirochaetota bacterium]|nr:TRL-like family protein [Spirochaetota bacterium]HNT12794.1 TRL-like family protein [Spirochaetota bacterium]